MGRVSSFCPPDWTWKDLYGLSSAPGPNVDKCFFSAAAVIADISIAQISVVIVGARSRYGNPEDGTKQALKDDWTTVTHSVDTGNGAEV